MDELGGRSIQLELKYCERCGGLWLRLKGSDAVFCVGCAKAMAGLRGGMNRHARRAPRVPDTIPACEVRSPEPAVGAALPYPPEVFWTEGGNA